MQKTFLVTGMTCSHCERAIINAVQALDLEAKVKIDRAQGQVVVQSTLSSEKITAAIAAEGYEVH